MNRNSFRRGPEDKVRMSWAQRLGFSNSDSVLCDRATNAETRLSCIKKAAKTLKKSEEQSLRTSTNKNQGEDADIEIRKKNCSEFILGDKLTNARQSLSPNDANSKINLSPLETVLERYANFEKTIAHMLAFNEQEIATFLASDMPLSKLLKEEIPAVEAAKQELTKLTRKHIQAQNLLDRETRKLEKMFTDEDVERDLIQQQEEKTKRLLHEEETLRKDVGLEQDKLTTLLLSLVSRENRYAESILELMRIKKQFYANAFQLISVELPNIERILLETQTRPMFGESIEDHLNCTNRTIAFPILLAVSFLRQTGLDDEGLFRISTKQIKLDKLKAYLDAQVDFIPLLQDCDAHFYAAFLKSYLRELPVPLLGRKNDNVYERWIRVTELNSKDEKIREIRYILKEELQEKIVINIQYMMKFLSELTGKSKVNKMTPGNLGIVLGPTLLRRSGAAAASELGNTDKVIKVIAMLVENYKEIFPTEKAWNQYDQEINTIMKQVSELPDEEDYGSASPRQEIKNVAKTKSEEHQVQNKVESFFSRFRTIEKDDSSSQ